MLRASLLDRFTDLFRCGEDDGCAIALHAGANDNRLAWHRAELARVGLQPQVELPDLLAPATRGALPVRRYPTYLPVSPGFSGGLYLEKVLASQLATRQR